MQDDGNAVIYAGNDPKWATDTVQSSDRGSGGGNATCANYNFCISPHSSPSDKHLYTQYACNPSEAEEKIRASLPNHGNDAFIIPTITGKCSP